MTSNHLQVLPKESGAPAGLDDQVHAEASSEFVDSAYVQDITARALSYLTVGYSVHLSGAAGTGKTTMAFHIATQLRRPVTLIHGDDEFGSSDLVGRNTGYRRSMVRDNYVHTVLKTEEEASTMWQDNRLTIACRHGCTLIYDEFNRSRPEANNALLSVLEEKILNMPKLKRHGDGYLEVHPRFRAIFTSNPEEYVGVHKTQDALLDRMITIRMGHFDRAMETQVVQAKSGLPRGDAAKIVDVVRRMRNAGVGNNRPTIRAGIAIGKVLAHCGGRARVRDKYFKQICRDVLNVTSTHVTKEGRPLDTALVEEIIHQSLSKQGGRKV